MRTRPKLRLQELNFFEQDNALLDNTNFVPLKFRDPVYQTLMRKPVITQSRYLNTNVEANFGIRPTDIASLSTHVRPIIPGQDVGYGVINTISAHNLIANRICVFYTLSPESDRQYFFLSARKVQAARSQNKRSFFLNNERKIIAAFESEVLGLANMNYVPLLDGTSMILHSPLQLDEHLPQEHLLFWNTATDQFELMEVLMVMEQSTAEQFRQSDGRILCPITKEISDGYFPHPFLEEKIAQCFKIQPDQCHAFPLTSVASTQNTQSIWEERPCEPVMRYKDNINKGVEEELIGCTKFFPERLRDPVFKTVMIRPVVTWTEIFEYAKTDANFAISAWHIPGIFNHATRFPTDEPKYANSWLVDLVAARDIIAKYVRLFVSKDRVFFLSAEKVQQAFHEQGVVGLAVARDGKIFKINQQELDALHANNLPSVQLLQECTWIILPSAKEVKEDLPPNLLLILNADNGEITMMKVLKVMDETTAQLFKHENYFVHPFLQNNINRRLNLPLEQRYVSPLTSAVQSENKRCTEIVVTEASPATVTSAVSSSSEKENMEVTPVVVPLSSTAAKGLKRFHLHNQNEEAQVNMASQWKANKQISPKSSPIKSSPRKKQANLGVTKPRSFSK